VPKRTVLWWLLLALATGCNASEAEREAQQQALASRVRVEPDGTIVLSQQERQALQLTTSPVAEGTTAGTRTAYGVVSAAPGVEVEVTAPIMSTVAGAPLVVLGERVRSGTPLVRLVPALDTADRATLAARRQELAGTIQELESRVRQQDAAAERAHKLSEQGIESLADLQAADADADAWRAQLASARSQLATVRQGTAETLTVRAPAAGTVASLDVEAGATVRQGAHLATVLGAGGGRRLDVGLAPGSPPASSFAVEVDSRWLPAKRIGGSAVVGADGLRHLLLELPAAASSLDPGATVLVRLQSGDTRGLALPAAAIVPTADGEVVFVVERPGRYRLRRVHVSQRGAEEVSLDRGLRAGEQVVTRGAMELWGEVVKAGGSGEER
jgi:membrane fusion protein, multidrug efflux system